MGRPVEQDQPAIVLRPFDPERVQRELPEKIRVMELALAKLKDCQKITSEILQWRITI